MRGLHRGQAQHGDGPGGGGAPRWLAGSQSGEADQPGGGPGPEGFRNESESE